MTKRAIIHVENSEGIIEFAKYLSNSGWTILSANKTEEYLKRENIPVVHEPALVENNFYVNDTSGLIRSILSSKIENELAIQDNEYTENNIFLVCMNITPMVYTTKATETSRPVNIPVNFYISSIIRNSVVNANNLLILTDPADYKEAVIQLKTDNVTKEFRDYLAAKALNMVAAYDSGIASSYLLLSETKSMNFTEYLNFPFTKAQSLHGGANIQQDACLYNFPINNSTPSGFKKIQGKELNYNIISDLSLAWELISLLYTNLKNQLTVKSTNCDGYNFNTQFTPLTGTVFTILVKYKSIIGAALNTNVLDSFIKTNSQNNEIVQNATLGCSAVIDEAAASEIVKYDFAAIVAPDFTEGAVGILSSRKSIRLIPTTRVSVSQFDLQLINGGLLFQTKDNILFNHWDVKTKMRPSQYLTDEMAFGTLLSMGSRTYSAVLLKDNAITGISQASKSPIKAVELALLDKNSNNNQAELLICDTAVPLCEPIKTLIDEGISAIIQTGGTSADDELIKYCDEHGTILIYTGMSHISY